MPKFKKCPRCDINYITEEEEFCPICQDELRGIIHADELDDEIEDGVCPRCKSNFIGEGEKFCETCLIEMENEREEKRVSSLIVDVEPDWEPEGDAATEIETVAVSDDDDDLEISLEELAEEESDEEEIFSGEENEESDIIDELDLDIDIDADLDDDDEDDESVDDDE